MKQRSYTLFSVTKENRQQRSERIRALFASEPILAFLVAVFDFEWTVRRSIVALSPCPTKKVHDAFAATRLCGWDGYKEAWEQLVSGMRKDVPRSMGVLLQELAVARGFKQRHFTNVGNILKLRHKLVHGVSGCLRASHVDEGFEVLLHASEAISEYVDQHANRRMFSRIVRRSACKACAFDKCAVSAQIERAKARKTKRAK